MKRPIENVTIRGRDLGILFLVSTLSIIGLIHLGFGLAMILGYISFAAYPTLPTIYSAYTLVYSLLTLFFAYLIWKRNRVGWVGTVGISLFVIAVDLLAALDLSNLLGIPSPSLAAGGIPFNIIIVFYLLQNHVRSKFNI